MNAHTDDTAPLTQPRRFVDCKALVAPGFPKEELGLGAALSAIYSADEQDDETSSESTLKAEIV